VSHEGLRYNEVRQKSVHNCFQRHEGVLDQFAYWRIRSFEVDIHRSKPYAPSLRNDWYVFHERWDAFTSVEKLSGLLSLLRAMHLAVPEHEIVTVFLDLKDPLSREDSSSHSGTALDRLLRERLGAALFTPADLLDGASTLQDAVAGGWPPLRELRGRVVFVLAGKREYVDGYAADDEAARDRVAFVSRRIDAAGDVPGPSHVLFYNMDARRVGLAASVHARGLVARAYYIDSKTVWGAARAASCHHIATDKVNSAEDPWSSTSGDGGWPFEALAGETPGEVGEAGEVCGVWSLTGDIWSDRDSLYFHYVERTAHDSDHTYDFYVSSPNSEVDDWAKACVMARGSLRQDSPYFGVFRTGEKSGLRVQLRDRAGAPTVRHEMETPAGFEPDTLALVRLRLSKGGRQTDGYASVDGGQWTHIARWGFTEPLRYQGLGVSGHDSREGVKFLFAVPRGGARPPFDRGRIIGPVTGRRGWSDWDGVRRWRVRAWDE
jgi:hypothetical protein